jgi:hypothetical protein
MIDLASRVMPAGSLVERRHSPRSVPANPEPVELRTEMEIEVVDLSERGLLLSCECPLEVGYRMLVHMVLGREPFMARIEITRVEAVCIADAPAANRYLAGAVFTSLDDRSQRTLRRFLPREPQLNPLPRQA